MGQIPALALDNRSMNIAGGRTKTNNVVVVQRSRHLLLAQSAKVNKIDVADDILE